TGSRTATFSLTAALVGVMVALEPNETSYSYNSRGDRTRITTPTGTVTNFAYDQADRLVGYGANDSYTYNGDGLRTSKTVNSTNEAFSWDTNTASGVPLLLVDGGTNYVYGPDGLPLEQINGSTVN